MPDLDVSLASGDTVALRSTFGEHLTVVTFWETSCPPCLRELPVIQRIYERWSDRGVEIVGVTRSSSRSEAAGLVAALGITYPTVMLVGSIGTSDLGSQIDAGIPFAVVLDGAGQQRLFLRGYRTSEETEALLMPFLPD
jgi:thiol-disulfide isomerase/thioredoxin